MSKKEFSDSARDCIRALRCDVTSCSYHDGTGFCTAREVKIGPSYAVSSTETICATYRPRYFRGV